MKKNRPNMSILGRGHSTTCGCDGCEGARKQRKANRMAEPWDSGLVKLHPAYVRMLGER